VNKNELILEVARKAGLSKNEAKTGISIAFDLVIEKIKKGEKVTLTGFGTFDLGSRKARTGVNPRTGDKIKIKATKIPRFHPSRDFRDQVK
jgi:DNA-binding protein HU-beta